MTSIREALRIPIVLAGVAFAVLAFPSGCASRSDENLGVENGGFPPSFVEAGADGCTGEAGCTDPNAFRPLCKATECPAPYETCESDSFRCETNFDKDSDNCGACGVKCPRGASVRSFFGAEWSCESGECRMVCDREGHTADCNKNVGDGCETNLMCDENNCGACGVKCPDGVACRFGQCGCRPGLTACDDSCVGQCLNLKTNDFNCGACGKECPTPTTAPPYPHTAWGCVESECGKLKCESEFMDCNKKLDPDGCEVSVMHDPDNCGACGTKCAPGQTCEFGECLCGPRETACTSLPPFFDCVDLDANVNNCGVCGHRCPEAPIETAARTACRFGHCELDCPSGYADCDGRAENGCETLVSADPRNCGACGVQCDLTLGQPCVGGACLMGPCNSGATQ